MPAQTWNIQKVSQPVFVEYSARDSIDYFVTVAAGVNVRLAPLTTDLEEKIPTLYANSMVIGFDSTFVGTVFIRKFMNAGMIFVDEVFAIGIGQGTVRSISLLECAEVWANGGAAGGTIRVTALARP